MPDQRQNLQRSQMKGETPVWWPRAELLHYKFSLGASGAHVILSLSRQHFTLPEGKQSNRVGALAKRGMSWAVCEVETRTFEHRRLISPLRSPSLAQTRDGHFQCAHGKWGM